MRDNIDKTAAEDIDELRNEIESILRPEQDPGEHLWDPPHPRLLSVHQIDASYFQGPFDPRGDRAIERLLEDPSDPLHNTLQSITVPFSLLMAAFNLFGDSLIEYHARIRRRDLYRYYPPILMTAWAAFEAWVRIASEVFISVVAAPALPVPVRNALLESRPFVERNGQIKTQSDRRPILDRYWLLLKYGFSHEFDRGSSVWQNAEKVAKLRDSLVHYDATAAPSLTASEIWTHMESVMLLFIAPSAKLGRTLLDSQFDLYATLAQLQPLISEFEERPLHKGWAPEAIVFSAPFDNVDGAKYPLAHQIRKTS